MWSSQPNGSWEFCNPDMGLEFLEAVKTRCGLTVYDNVRSGRRAAVSEGNCCLRLQRCPHSVCFWSSAVNFTSFPNNLEANSLKLCTFEFSVTAIILICSIFFTLIRSFKFITMKNICYYLLTYLLAYLLT